MLFFIEKIKIALYYDGKNIRYNKKSSEMFLIENPLTL